MSSLRKLKAGESIEVRSGGQKWNYVYVKDAARQIGELAMNAMEDEHFGSGIYNIASEDTRVLKEFIIKMKEICDSQSELRFGGYDSEKDVNLEPDMRKMKNVVTPLTMTAFEKAIINMYMSDIERVILKRGG